jgi:hypothetical protein
MEFIYRFVESPRQAINKLEIPGAEEKLSWTMDFEWPVAPPGKVYKDTEKRLYRAAMDVVALMSDDLSKAQEATIYEIEALLLIREKLGTPETSGMNYSTFAEHNPERKSQRTGYFGDESVHKLVYLFR